MGLKAIPRALDPNKRIIELLREALRDAKEGKVHAIGIAVGVTSDSPNAEGGRATETILAASDGWHHTLCTAVNGLAFRLQYERYHGGQALPTPDLSDEDE